MEEPLIIKRDEIIFKIGFYICLIALLCLIVSFAVISYNQWWHGSVYDESLIAEIFLWIFSFSIGGVPFGLLLIWDSYRHDYKLDENGITIRYRSSIKTAAGAKAVKSISVKAEYRNRNRFTIMAAAINTTASHSHSWLFSAVCMEYTARPAITTPHIAANMTDFLSIHLPCFSIGRFSCRPIIAKYSFAEEDRSDFV